MGINKLLSLLGMATFSQGTVMAVLFGGFYLALGMVALSRPVAAVVMYFGTSIMNPQASFPLLMNIPLAKISALFCLGVCLINAPRLRFRRSWTFVPLACFLVMANLAAVYALQPELAERRFEEFNKVCLMVVLAVWAVKERRDYDFLFWGILGSVFYDVLKNLVETQTKEVWVAAKGVAGWISDSNDWALALTMSLPLFYAALARHWGKGWKVRLVLGMATAGALLTLTLTSSRGGFLAAVAATAVFILLDRRPWRMIGAAMAIVAVVSFYMPSAYLEKIESIFGLREQAASAWEKNIPADEVDYTGAERVFFWRIAYEVMRDHPLTGVGWGNFIKEFERRQNVTEGAVAHSSWFQVGAESGMVGLGFYALTIASAIIGMFVTWLRARRAKDDWADIHCRAVLAGLIAFCVGGSFLSRENSELLFLYIAMSVQLGALVRQGAPVTAEAQAMERAAKPGPVAEPAMARAGGRGGLP